MALIDTALDIANCERVDQAVVSNAVGFGAAWGVGVAADAGATILAASATGAAWGSAVPVVGTVVGAAVGAVVGTFMTGAVASLWDDHPSVAHAWDAGVDAVENTGKAIGNAAVDTGEAIGHAASSTWHSLFG